MKSIDDFLKEYYDSPDVPKVSEEDIRDMVHVRPYHNKFQNGFYHKGSADLNIAIHDKSDQEKYDILTVLHSKVKKYIDVNIFEDQGNVDINKYHEGQFEISYYIKDKIIKTESGDVEIYSELHVHHYATGNEDFDHKKGTYSVRMWLREKNSEYKTDLSRFGIDDADLYRAEMISDNLKYDEVEKEIKNAKKMYDDFFFYLKDFYEVNDVEDQLLSKES